MNGYWITESTTYKIYANSEEEARKIWKQYWDEGKNWTELDMQVKDGDVEADWDWLGDSYE